ncbi:Fc.00g087530.m01.CDS01 [Cosmosporella sp. VM-42]
MPTYLCHGFRWHRRAIRIFVILQDLEDAAPDWITGPTTSSAILSQLHESYKFLPDLEVEECAPTSTLPKPEPLHQDDDFALPPLRVSPSQDNVLMHSWSAVKLLEEHDPDDLTYVSRPYAYVADYVVRVDLSVDLAAEMARYESRAKEEGGWFGKLRDELQNGEEVKWYVVVCGDESRDFEEETDEEGSQDTERGISERAQLASVPIRGPRAQESEDPSLRDSMAPPASAYTEPTITRPKSPSGQPPAPTQQTETASSTIPSPGKHLPVPNEQSTEEDTSPARQTNSPKLEKRKSRAAGLRRLFKKKDDPKGAQ